MVISFIDWLKKYPLLNIVLVLCYGVALIFFHDFFVQLSVKAMNGLSLAVYNNVVLAVSVLLGLSLLGFLLFRLVSTKEQKTAKLTFLLITFLLVALHYKFLFEMNIEVIHVIEFALLSFLLFPLLKSFSASIVFTLPFIFVNEWYQYVVLYPKYILYFEFNDIVFDLLGCGLLMILLWVLGAETKPIKRSWWKRPELLFLFSVDVLFALLVLTCTFSFYTETKCDNTIFVLNGLADPHTFWHTHVFGAVYHVMKPLEGLVAVNLVCLFFIAMDSVAARSRPS